MYWQFLQVFMYRVRGNLWTSLYHSLYKYPVYLYPRIYRDAEKSSVATTLRKSLECFTQVAQLSYNTK